MKVINQGRPKSSYFVAFEPPGMSVDINEEIEKKYPGTKNSATIRFLMLREIKK